MEIVSAPRFLFDDVVVDEEEDVCDFSSITSPAAMIPTDDDDDDDEKEGEALSVLILSRSGTSCNSACRPPLISLSTNAFPS